MDLTEPLHIRTDEVVARRGAPPWTELLLEDGRNAVELACTASGETGHTHAHPDQNEWWIVVQGEHIVEIEGSLPIRAKKGDVVFCPAGVPHSVTAGGAEPAVRLAVSRLDSLDVRGQRGGPSIPAAPSQPPNMRHTSLVALYESSGGPPWKHVLVDDDRNKAHLICHPPGMSNRAHWHYDFDEWWLVMQGELTWEIGDRPAIRARDGDIVYSPRGFRHSIQTVSPGPSLRLAVTPPDNPHIWTDEDGAAPPPRE